MTGRDRGAQPERTRLAWRRTVLAATVLLPLVARQVVDGGLTAPGAIVLAATALLWLALLVGAQRRITTLARSRPPALAAPWPAAAVTVALALVALAALSLVS